LGRIPGSENANNPHSSSGYQTIQFTARALVRTTTPSGPARTFVPFEVQIMDEEAYRKSQEGLANHEAYRQRQRFTVSRRVFPWVNLELTRQIGRAGTGSLTKIKE
jgi:uncharacterized protein (TIGR04562 family)